MTVVAGVSADRAETELLREAARLAGGLDEEFHAVHIVPESRFEELVAEGDVAPTFGKVREEARSVATDAVDDALATVDDDDTAPRPTPGDEALEAVGLVGDPTTELVEYANQVDASLIAVGGRKRSPVGKALFGGVTQAVLQEADRPVVTRLLEE